MNNTEDNKQGSMVEALQQVIKETEKQIEDIQKDCEHVRSVKNINATGAADLRVVCSKCQHVIGYPTQEEIDKWIS